MSLDIQYTLDVMTDALLRELGDEVELIFRYGSHLKGTTHHYSDVDISYVPIHEQTGNNITVLVDDTLVDLYPLHWSQLERMADFDDVRGTILLNPQVIYQRSPEAATRLAALSARLRALQQPHARRKMVHKAQTLFQVTGYSYYLLRQQAAKGHLLACFQQSQNIVNTVFHALAVCNQAAVDTRKIAQVLALSKLPEGFAALVEAVTFAHTPEALLTSCAALLDATHEFLLTAQYELASRAESLPTVFRAAYPELRADLQHAMLACEREDMFSLKGSLMSFYHELMVHLSQALTGVEYSGFNSLAEYEQDLGARDFPPLWPYVVSQDYAGLQQACRRFDQRLREFLTESGVALNAFPSTDALQAYLEKERSG